MKSQLSRVLFTSIVFCIVATSIGQPKTSIAGSPPSGGAIVLDVTGKVTARSPKGDKLNVLRSTVFLEGTTIETNSDAQILLRLEDGSEVLLRSGSSLVLRQQALPTGSTLFELILGRLRAVVTKRFTGTPSFQLGTPSAIVAVRGTQFEVEVNSHGVTEVDVQQGIVQVTGRYATDRFVILEPGFSTRVGPDMIPERPVPTDRMRPDAREEQESKSKKTAPKAAHDSRQLPGEAPTENGQGTEPPEPSQPTEPHE